MGLEKIFRELLVTAGIKGPSTANLMVQLGDAAGTYKVSIVDSSTTEVASINSDGGVTGVTATFSGTLTGSSNLSVTGTATVSGTFTASSSAAVTGGLTVGGTLTGSSASTLSGAVTASTNVTVGGTLTASSASTLSGAVTASTNMTVGGTLTASSASTLSGAVTASTNATVGGTLTASSGLSASQGVTLPRAAASTAANLVSYGLIDITSTSASAYVLDAPVAGREVVIFKTGNSTQIATVTVNSTATVTFDGTNTVLTFNGVNQVARLIGNSSTRWLLTSSTGQVGAIA